MPLMGRMIVTWGIAANVRVFETDFTGALI